MLGAGGLVGMAYHAGALHALEQEAGLAAGDAELVIGTSAGAVVGAYLRTGWSAADFWAAALDVAPRDVAGGRGVAGGGVGGDGDGGGAGGGDTAGGVAGLSSGLRRGLSGLPSVMTPAFASPLQLVRRGLGSAYVMARAALRVPVPVLPRFLGRAFPGGLFAMGDGQRRLDEELPEVWPDGALWLCSVDIVSGRRVVLGRPGAPPATLTRAVLASCAIPGLYPPVKLGRHVLVDGAAHSTTNLDLAAAAGCPLVVVVAPLAFDTARAPGMVSQLVRRYPARSLSHEVAGARRQGSEVLMVRPTGPEVRAHGLNLMRRDGLDRIARSAYQSTARLLDTDRFSKALASLDV